MTLFLLNYSYEIISDTSIDARNEAIHKYFNFNNFNKIVGIPREIKKNIYLR